MAKQKKTPNPPTIAFRVTKEFRREIEKAASSLELRPSSFIRLAVRSYLDHKHASDPAA